MRPYFIDKKLETESIAGGGGAKNAWGEKKGNTESAANVGRPQGINVWPSDLETEEGEKEAMKKSNSMQNEKHVYDLFAGKYSKRRCEQM